MSKTAYLNLEHIADIIFPCPPPASTDPQGGVLEPLLGDMYISESPEERTELNVHMSHCSSSLSAEEVGATSSEDLLLVFYSG